MQFTLLLTLHPQLQPYQRLDNQDTAISEQQRAI